MPVVRTQGPIKELPVELQTIYINTEDPFGHDSATPPPRPKRRPPYPERARRVHSIALHVEFFVSTFLLIFFTIAYLIDRYYATHTEFGPLCKTSKPGPRKLIELFDAGLPFYAARYISLLQEFIFSFWEDIILYVDGKDPATSVRYTKFLNWRLYGDVVGRVVATAVFLTLFQGKGMFTRECLRD